MIRKIIFHENQVMSFTKNKKVKDKIKYQVVGLMMYLGKNAEAKTVVEDAKTSRIADQIMLDGTQPQRMARKTDYRRWSGKSNRRACKTAFH